MKRDQLLILISVIFLSVSAYILYTAFFATPGSVAVLTIPNVDQDKTNLLNVRALDKQIEGSIKTLDQMARGISLDPALSINS
jgi:hypothetical protein